MRVAALVDIFFEYRTKVSLLVYQGHFIHRSFPTIRMTSFLILQFLLNLDIDWNLGNLIHPLVVRHIKAELVGYVLG